jgi:hypothetical protein
VLHGSKHHFKTASDVASYATGEIGTADGGRMTLNYTVPVAD